MKVKIFLICFLSLCAISLSSCKKDNYSDKFVGAYDMKATPYLFLHNVMGEEEALPPGYIDSFICSISETERKDVVNISITEQGGLMVDAPVFTFKAVCSETGMTIEETNINKNITLSNGSTAVLNITTSSTHVDLPVNNMLSWKMILEGTVGTYIPGLGSLNLGLRGDVDVELTKKIAE